MLAKPIIDEYKKFLEEIYKNIFSKRSKMGQAIYYSLNNINKLSNYLLDGRLEIDNRTERYISPFTISRKNWIFSFTDRGANSSTIVYSVTTTVIENHLKVFEYFTYLFDNLAKYNLYNLSENDIAEIKDKLLPYSPNLPINLKLK